jgi:hypothetical protein
LSSADIQQNKFETKRSEAKRTRHARTHARTHLTRRSLPSLIARGRHLAWTSVGREWPSLETAFRRRTSIPTESHRAGKVTVGSKTPAMVVRTSAFGVVAVVWFVSALLLVDW